eukprot:2468221-Pyramimonas_sp.AAC.1
MRRWLVELPRQMRSSGALPLGRVRMRLRRGMVAKRMDICADPATSPSSPTLFSVLMIFEGQSDLQLETDGTWSDQLSSKGSEAGRWGDPCRSQPRCAIWGRIYTTYTTTMRPLRLWGLPTR